MSNGLKGQPGELRATITITRKATGKKETFEIVGKADPEKLKALGVKIHGSEGDVVNSGPSAVNVKEKENDGNS